MGELQLSTITTNGVVFETGRPVEFLFSHNTESSPKVDGFQQDLDISGMYVVGPISESSKQHIETQLPDNYMTGVASFQNPLVIPFNTSGVISYDDTSWKAALYNHYGATGRELADKVRADGYDGIVTTHEGDTSEIVCLTSAACKGFKTAKRPVPIDEELATQIADRYMAFLHNNEDSLHEKSGLYTIMQVENETDVRGESINIDIDAHFDTSMTATDQAKAGGWSDVAEDGTRSITLNFNPNYKYWPQLLEEHDALYRSIFDTVAHENIHAVDLPGEDSNDTADPVAYYNDPRELRAWSRGIGDEILTFFRKGDVQPEDSVKVRTMAFRKGLKESQRYREMAPHLTDESRKQVVQLVYGYLTSLGYFPALRD